MPDDDTSTSEWKRQMEADLQALARVQILSRSMLPPEQQQPRISIAAAAAGKGLKISKNAMTWLGIATVLAQLVSAFYPHLEAPIHSIFVALAAIAARQ